MFDRQILHICGHWYIAQAANNRLEPSIPYSYKKSGGSPYLTHLNPSILDFGISWFHRFTPKRTGTVRHRGLSSLVPGWVHEWNRRHGVDVIFWHNKSSGQKLWMLYCYIMLYLYTVYIYYLLDVMICCYLSVVFLRLQKPSNQKNMASPGRT